MKDSFILPAQGGSLACGRGSQVRHEKEFSAKKLKVYFKGIAPSPETQVSSKTWLPNGV